jgi:hypothetical protein
VTSEWSDCIIMDQYPKVNVEVQEHPSTPSRHDSASSLNKHLDFHSPPSLVTSRQPSQTMSSTTNNSNISEQQQTTANPPTSNNTAPQEHDDSSHADGRTTKELKAKFARYIDAPPPYSDEQFEDKTEEQQINMRAHDYAKELSRTMGQQFVRGLNANNTKE